jgi:hypothetical protein
MENTERIIRDCAILTRKLTDGMDAKDPQNNFLLEAFAESEKMSNESLQDSADDNQEDSPVSSVEFPILEKAIQFFRSNITKLSYFNGETNRFLDMVQLSSKEISERTAIVEYLKSQIRLSLSCSMFVTDLEAIQSTTFNERKITINLLIGKSYQPSWDSILLEHLNYLAETTSSRNFPSEKSNEFSTVSFDSGSPSLDPTESTSFSTNISAEFNQSFLSLSNAISGSQMSISNICLHNGNLSALGERKLTHGDTLPYITCKINNCNVEIKGNPLPDLCLLTLMEEIASLVGKDKLFKRSLIVITSFVHNELKQLFSKKNLEENGKRRSNRDMIPDSVLWVMVCSVFNKFHGLIESPLQALLLFMIEYCFYDPKRSIITIYGRMELTPPSPTLPNIYNLFVPKINFLIKPSLLEKYWNFVNVEETNLNNEVFNSTLAGLPNVQKKFQPAVISFPVFSPLETGLSAIHPLNNTLMQSSPIELTTTRLQIAEIFQFGLMKVMKFMEEMSSLGSLISSEPMKLQVLCSVIFPEVNKKIQLRGNFDR